MRAAALILVCLGAVTAAFSPAPAAPLQLEVADVDPIPDRPGGGDRAVAGTVWFHGFPADEATGEPVNATYSMVPQIPSAESGGASVWGRRRTRRRPSWKAGSPSRWGRRWRFRRSRRRRATFS